MIHLSKNLGVLCAVALAICSIARAADEIALDLGGGEKIEFVWVPVEGSDGRAAVKIGDQTGAHKKEPVKSETIWGPFQDSDQHFGYYLAKTEVTEAQWALVMGGNNNDRTPVTGKTFLEILGFIETLNAKTPEFAAFPRTGDGTPGVIRLPSEVEWEYAARGGRGPEYAANDPYKGDIGRHEMYSTPGSNGRAQEVATFQPNALGLYDMLGNVREFVGGSYSIGGMHGGYLLKGGSYLSERSEIRSSARTEQSRTGKDGKPVRRLDAGFRVCISSEVFTSLGQAQDVIDKLGGTTGGESITEINLEEAVKLDEKRKRFEVAAEASKRERQKLAEIDLEKRRKATALAEQIAKEEQQKLANLKKAMENPVAEPAGSAPSAEEQTPEAQGSTLEQLLARAQQGDEDAIWNVAMAYFHGWPVAENWVESAKWFVMLAGRGNTKAILNLGIILWEQNSPIRDTQKAAQLFLEAAKRDEPEAVVFLSECVRDGFTGKNPDPKTAVRMLVSAAQERNLFAINALGWWLLDGSDELPKSEQKARSLFEKAWSEGHAPSAHALAFIYRNGLGVPKDLIKAREYYRLAAEDGYPAAQNSYARFLSAGTGGGKDEQEAVRWFSEAAKSGDKNAKSNLKDRGIFLL